MSRWRFLTPDTSKFVEAIDCRCISLPGSLWPLVSGALSELIYTYNWEQYGDATPDEAAAFFLSVYEDFLMSKCAYVGEVRAFSGTVPSLWLALDGSSLDEDDYPGLAAAVPSSWLSGGTINLPDMNGRAVIGAGVDYDLGDVGGESEHTLTVAEMPAHTHSYDVAVIATDILGAEPAPALNSLTATATGSTGDGDPHNNMPPFLALNWAIYAGV